MPQKLKPQGVINAKMSYIVDEVAMPRNQIWFRSCNLKEQITRDFIAGML